MIWVNVAILILNIVTFINIRQVNYNLKKMVDYKEIELDVIKIERKK